MLSLSESSLLASTLPGLVLHQEFPRDLSWVLFFSLSLPCSDLPYVVFSGDRVPVAQLVQRRAVMRVVVSSTRIVLSPKLTGCWA